MTGPEQTIQIVAAAPTPLWQWAVAAVAVPIIVALIAWRRK